MKNCTKRWLYLLAGSALSAKEIREMCAWLSEDTPDDVVAIVMQLRHQELETLPTAEDEKSFEAQIPSDRITKRDMGNDTTAEIAFILRTESHLTAREAAIRLAKELEEEMLRFADLQKGVVPKIPSYSRESFNVYVGRLLKHTSPQMLLHLAHRIRDSVVGRRASAWPLRASAS